MNKQVELSRRLQALAEMVTPGLKVCDVGCDHGYLSIYLVQKQISPAVIAMDVRTGPLERCVEHVSEYEMAPYIETRLSDGLTLLKQGEVQAVVIAGMGGRLMMKILTEGSQVARQLQEIILQPQSEVMQFREFLSREGYCILAENMIEEEGKFYPMMKVTYRGKGEDAKRENGVTEQATHLTGYTSVENRFGPILLQEKNTVLHQFLIYRKGVLDGIKAGIRDLDKAADRLSEIDSELEDIEAAFTYF